MKKQCLMLIVLACVWRVEAVSMLVDMLPGEEWRGAATYFGAKMPFGRGSIVEIDLRAYNYSNQYSSLLLSNRGRVLWCDVQAKFSISNGVIAVEARKKPVLTQAGKTLRDAFLFASKTYFPPNGKTPDLLFFAAPQYNTWIELTYNQNEKDILAYAQSMLDNGCPPGVFMIDDTWQCDYGDWNFDGRRFSNPKGMVKKLHEMGLEKVSFDEILKTAGSSVGRPHLTRHLMEKGYCKEFTEAFEKYIGEGKPAYVKRESLSPCDMTKLIHSVGGISVVAHPKLIEDDRLLTDLIGCGIDGIEVVCPSHQKSDEYRYSKFADEHGLLKTGGSDFHGANNAESIGTSGMSYENFLKIKMQIRFWKKNLTLLNWCSQKVKKEVLTRKK